MLAGDQPEEVLHVDGAVVARRADALEVVVHPLAQRLVDLQLVVRLAQVERADVADRHQRVAAGRLGVGEDARVQVDVVVGLGLVDVAGAGARHACVSSIELEADLRRERLRRDVELLRRQARETALVVGDLLHGRDPSLLRSARPPVPPRGGTGARRSADRRTGGSGWSTCAVHAPRAVRARSRPARSRRAVAALLLDEVVEPARLVDVLGDVRRERRRHLALREQRHRELDLLDRLHDPLRLRDELGLAQPAGRLRGGDEPLRVPRAHVAVDAVLHRLGAELRDRVARVDALRAALVAEVAARAVPDPVLLRVALEPLDRARRRAGRRRSGSPSRAPPGRGSPDRTPSSCTPTRSSRS